jgi:uncharacterized RDD family membrane protein YckC
LLDFFGFAVIFKERKKVCDVERKRFENTKNLRKSGKKIVGTYNCKERRMKIELLLGVFRSLKMKGASFDFLILYSWCFFFN